ncbi:MAG: hypothetical protein H8D23_19805 [Candidatus Brocadiales bacterium]|nr:hypothetical protein [Candidatus Brocadiales bacterium]
MKNKIAPKSHIGDVADLENRTDLAVRILEVRNRCGLINVQLLEMIGERMGVRIPPSNLSAWIRGKIPTKYSEATILSILDDIEAKYKISNDSKTYVDQDEITRTFNEWLKVITIKQIAIASEEVVQNIYRWKEGKSPIKTRKWRTLKSKIEPFVQYYKSQS